MKIVKMDAQRLLRGRTRGAAGREGEFLRG
jgi:hypothetical protein